MKHTSLIVSLSRAWWLFAAVIACALLWTAHAAGAESSETVGGNRLVTIHDRGEEQTIVTKAATVRAALAEAGVTVNESDITEPRLQTQLSSGQYSINIYRARPVVVEDGATKVRVMTAAQSSTGIAKAARIPLHTEDRTSMGRVDDVVSEGGAGLKMSIDRAAVFTLVLYGKPIEARTQATTVGGILKEKNIVLGKDDGTSLPQTTPVTNGMTLSVWRNGVQTVTLEEEVAMPVRQIQDLNQPFGYQQVQTPGKAGKKQVTYQIETRNGQEVARKAIQSVVSEQPVEQVVAIGAKAKPITGTCGEWMAAAGVAPTASANYLIAKESGCNPNSVNRSSGACGIGQALPCSKMGPVNPDGTSAVDPVGQMSWMNSYVMGRYGSWDAAAAHHRSYGWY